MTGLIGLVACGYVGAALADPDNTPVAVAWVLTFLLARLVIRPVILGWLDARRSR